jgi:hypothetical protein
MLGKHGLYRGRLVRPGIVEHEVCPVRSITHVSGLSALILLCFMEPLPRPIAPRDLMAPPSNPVAHSATHHEARDLGVR